MPTEVSKRQHAVKSKRTAAGDAFSRLVIRIFQLNGVLLGIGDALSAPAGQSSARWQVLAAVEDAPLSVADIARALRLARQSVQRVADLLVGDGLAEYADNPQHQRAKLLKLRPAGRAALRSISTAQIEWANRAGEVLGLAELRRANDLLSRALETIEALETLGAPD